MINKLHNTHQFFYSGHGRGEMIDEKNSSEEYEGIPTIREIGDHIRPITLTRNKMCSMLKSRKFSDIVKGCFVRYKSESSAPNANGYMLAQIVGVTEGDRSDGALPVSKIFLMPFFKSSHLPFFIPTSLPFLVTF